MTASSVRRRNSMRSMRLASGLVLVLAPVVCLRCRRKSCRHSTVEEKTSVRLLVVLWQAHWWGTPSRQKLKMMKLEEMLRQGNRTTSQKIELVEATLYLLCLRNSFRQIHPLSHRTHPAWARQQTPSLRRTTDDHVSAKMQIELEAGVAAWEHWHRVTE